MTLLLAIVLMLFALGGVVVRKTYNALPIQELKRKAEKHDPVASRLYRAAAYDGSLRGLLWLFIGLTAAGSIVLLVRHASPLVSILIIGPALWIAFSWLPVSRVTGFGTRLTLFVTPAIVWLLNYLHPLLGRGSEVIQRKAVMPHTGVFEREDLLRLIEQQQRQLDNRLSDEELEIVKRALSFDDHVVADILTPRKQIKTVKQDDTVGPLLIDEIHKSGSGYAIVREKAKDPILGTLAFAQLNVRSSGKVKNTMSSTVYYLHENDSLGQALHAFFVTNHPVFVVINSFEEYVGLVSIEDVLKLLLGHVPGEDFDEYTNPVAVATRHKRKPETADENDETPVETEEEVVK